MTRLSDIVFLAAPTFRSRAYAQFLRAAGIRPACVYLMPGDEPEWDGEREFALDLKGNGDIQCFRPGEPISDTLSGFGVECVAFPHEDINSTECIESLAGIGHKIILYSGVAGCLLSEKALLTGNRFLHVHGGYLPVYRGSTAFYYSLLKDNAIGASAIWLAGGIDSGEVIFRREYTPQAGIEVDNVMDPMVRADVLAEVLKRRIKTGEFSTEPVENPERTPYFVIHPVLKHLALKRLNLVK